MATLLFVTFLIALTNAQARGRRIACACFGGNSELETVGPHSIVRTALLFALAVVAIFPTHSARLLEVVGFAAILAALIAVVSELARLLGPLRRTTGFILEQVNVAAIVADEAEVTQ